jgi:hypothetical protein
MGDAEGVASKVAVNVPVWLPNAVFWKAPPATAVTHDAATGFTMRVTFLVCVSAALVPVTDKV